MEEKITVINGNINKRPLELGSTFTNMSPSRLPLLGSASSSFQVWKKPYLMNFLGSTTNTSTNDEVKLKAEDVNFHPSDHKFPRSSDGDDDISGANRDINGDPVGLSTEKVTTNGVQFKIGHNEDPGIDLKKKKRIISNRVSARRCRMRKLQYVAQMEQQVRDLQAQIAELSPQLSLYQNQNHLLQMEHENLSTQMSVYASNRLVQDAAIAENKAEVNRLRQLKHELQQHRLHKHTKFLDLGLAAGFEQLLNPSLIAALEQYFELSSQEDGDIGCITTEVNNLDQLNMKTELKQEEVALGEVLNMALANNWDIANDAAQEQKPSRVTPKSSDPLANPWTSDEADA